MESSQLNHISIVLVIMVLYLVRISFEPVVDYFSEVEGVVNQECAESTSSRHSIASILHKLTVSEEKGCEERFSF